MKQFLIARWQPITIGVCLIIIGLLLAQTCRHSEVNTGSGSMDSLRFANTITQDRYNHLSDSVEVIVKKKDDSLLNLTKTIKRIEYKYALLRQSRPSVDTVVKTHIVYQGMEAIEKLPLLENQVQVLQSEVVDLKGLVRIKTDQNLSLQGQFDRAVVISNQQSETIKKLDKKRKWNKIWAVTGSCVSLGLVVAVLLK